MKTKNEILLQTHGDSDLDIVKVHRAMDIYSQQNVQEERDRSAPRPIETPAIATSEGVEEAAEEHYPIAYDMTDAVAEFYNEEKQDINLSERRAFIKGASHILTTHVPVDEVEKIINNSIGSDGKIHWPNLLIKQIKSLKSKTVI